MTTQRVCQAAIVKNRLMPGLERGPYEVLLAKAWRDRLESLEAALVVKQSELGGPEDALLSVTSPPIGTGKPGADLRYATEAGDSLVVQVTNEYVTILLFGTAGTPTPTPRPITRSLPW